MTLASFPERCIASLVFENQSHQLLISSTVAMPVLDACLLYIFSAVLENTRILSYSVDEAVVLNYDQVLVMQYDCGAAQQELYSSSFKVSEQFQCENPPLSANTAISLSTSFYQPASLFSRQSFSYFAFPQISLSCLIRRSNALYALPTAVYHIYEAGNDSCISVADNTQSVVLIACTTQCV